MYVSLALVGLLVVSANCGESDFDAVVLNSNLFGEQPAENSPYWWMSKGSPFKRAVAAGPPQQNFDFGANPFLRSGSNAKLYSAPGYLPPDQQGPQTVPCQGNGRTCVPKYQCQGGYVDASQLNGQSSQECNAESETCCQVRVPTPPPRPSPPPTRNTYIPPPPPTPRVQATPCYDRTSVCVPANQCNNGAVSRGSPYASRAPASQCLAPEVCCRVPDEPRPTAAPSVTVISYQPSPSTPRPYVAPTQTPRPQVITKKPQVNNQYLPPRDNEVPQGNNPVGAYLPPETGEDQKSPEINPDSNNYNPSIVRPNKPEVGNDELSEPILPPAACPAATNCTDISYCNADGTISTSPVSLTPEQETYRVPLSPCRDDSKGLSQGVCCRDPNYTDPWPTNLLRTGAFDANVLAQAFDDGQYRPNGNGNARNQRGEALKSPQINPINPFTASSQQTKQYTLAPFIPNAKPNNNQPKTSVSQQPTSPNPFNYQPNQQSFSPPPQFTTSQQNNPTQPQFVPRNQPALSSQLPSTVAQASTKQYVTTSSFPTPSPVQLTPDQPGLAPQQPQSFQPEQPQRLQQQPLQLQQLPLQPGQPQQTPFQPQQPQQSSFQQPQPQQSSFQPPQPQQSAFQPPQPQQSAFQSPQPQQSPFQPQPPQPASFQNTPSQNPFRANQLGVCSVRDQLGLPRGNAPNEAAFGEFPWQAMILRESTKTILCGGAIIEKNLVATAAHCVDGLRTHDVLIKGGEWKLGSNEEPKPFQTVRVRKITMHPAYQPTNLESDIALLHLENDLQINRR